VETLEVEAELGVLAPPDAPRTVRKTNYCYLNLTHKLNKIPPSRHLSDIQPT
jgi:hypothetical protein